MSSIGTRSYATAIPRSLASSLSMPSYGDNSPSSVRSKKERMPASSKASSLRLVRGALTSPAYSPASNNPSTTQYEAESVCAFSLVKKPACPSTANADAGPPAWEEPDTFEAGSTLIWRGRARRRKARLVEVNRIRKVIYARNGLSPDGDNDDESTADDDLDIALLDHVQPEWDRELERLLGGLSKRS